VVPFLEPCHVGEWGDFIPSFFIHLPTSKANRYPVVTAKEAIKECTIKEAPTENHTNVIAFTNVYTGSSACSLEGECTIE